MEFFGADFFSRRLSWCPGGWSGRVAPGDYSPEAPTDPYVQDSRIRFLKQPLRCTTHVMRQLMLSAFLVLTRARSTMPPTCFRPTVWLLGIPLPIPRVLAGHVTQLRRFCQGATTSCRASRFTSFFLRWRIRRGVAHSSPSHASPVNAARRAA